MRGRTGIAAITVVVTMAGHAWAADCEGLYVERNGIYKAQGYCFKTARAIATFGNAGCQYDDIEEVPLSSAQRRAVAEMTRLERTLGCR